MPEEMLSSEGFNPEALEIAVEEALEGTSRAQELRRLKNALLRRREMLESDLAVADEQNVRVKLRGELEQLDAHVAVLEEEACISQFIEETVRFSAEVRRLQQG